MEAFYDRQDVSGKGIPQIQKQLRCFTRIAGEGAVRTQKD